MDIKLPVDAREGQQESPRAQQDLLAQARAQRGPEHRFPPACKKAAPIWRGFYRPGRNRTCNPRFWRPVLYQLSYGPKLSGWLTGIEPATSGATVRRSNRLSYNHREEPAPRKRAGKITAFEGVGSRPKALGQRLGGGIRRHHDALERRHRHDPPRRVGHEDRSTPDL